MNHYPLQLLLIVCLTAISCNSKPQHSEEDITQEQSEPQNANFVDSTEEVVEIPETDDVPKEFMQICKAFYDKVCFGYSSPNPKLSENGFYILDLTTYKKNLQSLGIFTRPFIHKQDELFSECTKALEKDSITPEKVPEGIDAGAPIECGFFHYNYYLSSQEPSDGFYLRKSNIKDSIGVTEVHFYNKTEKSYFNWDHQVILKLELQKVNASWKINNVQRILPER